MNFFDLRFLTSSDDRAVKISVLGDKKTGKTTIIKALMQKPYKISAANMTSSIFKYEGRMTERDAEEGTTVSIATEELLPSKMRIFELSYSIE
jgi:signal recognition particle receptor subunit beta